MGRHRRLSLKHVTVKTIDDDLLQAEVTLDSSGKFFVGDSSGKNGKDAELHLTVEATLNAISQAITRPIKFYISNIEVKEIGEESKRFIVVLLKTDYFIEPVGEAIELLGACQISNSANEAAVRAVLDATNRTTSLLLI